jgi:uncharacterized protein (TIGR03437 family)
LLGGTTVKITDSAGIERLAPLFFVSPGQVNYQVPGGTAIGEATVTVTNRSGIISAGTIHIAPTAPGLFAANSNGQGVAAAVALRVRSDGSESYEPVAQFDAAQNRFVARPLDLGAETDQIYLLLFGTGMRYRSALSAVSVKMGGVEVPVLYAGEQGSFAGLDQLNVQVPRSLAGRGEIDIVLTVDGQSANAVKANIRGQASAMAAKAESVITEAVNAPPTRRPSRPAVVLPILDFTRPTVPNSGARRRQ